jgi:EAL domain-containing protein (putative c-di-GMP-specific phosphodiesterase class I)
MFGSNFLNLLQTIADLFLFLIAGFRLYPAFAHTRAKWNGYAIGGWLGCTVLLAALLPIDLAPAGLFGLACVLLALSAWNGGVRSVLVALPLSAISLYVDDVPIGVGWFGGLCAALVGLMFYYWNSPSFLGSFAWKSSSALGLLVSANATAWTPLLLHAKLQGDSLVGSIPFLILFTLAAIAYQLIMSSDRSHGKAIVNDDTPYADDGSRFPLSVAKEQTSNLKAQADEAMNEQHRRRARLEADLRTALQDRQLSLVFQPQYELSSGQPRGVEALLRWHHPELGDIPPSEFIAMMEQSGEIIPVGEWVLLEACRAALRLAPEPSGLLIAVNLSPLQLMDDQFPDYVRDVLALTGINPRRLELELTETVLIQSLETVERQMNRLRGLGVRLALDDFGTGYSSLHYLRKLPFELVKIDKSFIDDLGAEDDRNMIGSLIQFMKQLQFTIVAEGLESYDQLAYLKCKQCDYAQGYLLSRPLTEDQLAQLIQQKMKTASLSD